jgi:hypothetical protein
MQTFKGQGSQRPTAYGTLLQSASYGSAIPNGYGMTMSVLLATWAANLRQGGGTKKFKQMKKGIVSYVENIDFLLGHSPIRGVLQLMVNGGLYPLTFTSQSFSYAGGTGSVEVTDENFYFVTAVTLEGSYSFDVDDYGGQGPTTLSGNWEIPLWNELETGPDPSGPSCYRNWPYCYRWQQGMGATVFIDSALFPGGTVKVYYAQLMEATSFQPPITKNKLEFEPQLGSGSEYATAGNIPGTSTPYTSQQIVYPHFAGLQSSEIDLGAGAAIPQLGPEVAFKWGLYPPFGDADFADMIEDIFKSGLAQAAIAASTSTQPQPATTQMERGLSSYNLPGTIQKKIDASQSAALEPLIYNMPNTAGNVLVAVVQSGGALTISSSNGETWTPIYGSALGWQVWVAPAVGGPNTVTISGSSAPWAAGILEIGGVGPSGPIGQFAWAYPAAAPTDGLINLIGSFADGSGVGPVTYAGFAVPGGLPAGAVVTRIIPVCIGSIAISAVSAAYFAGGTCITFPSPSGLGFDGTFVGSSIGTTVPDISLGSFTFQVATSPFSAGTGSIDIQFIGLQVFYELGGSGEFGSGATLDAAATASGASLSAPSTVNPGWPGYLLAIPFYGAGSVEVSSGGVSIAELAGFSFLSNAELIATSFSSAEGNLPAGWDAATPPNFYAGQPPTFNLFERIIRSPGTFGFTALGPTPETTALLTFKSLQPPSYPRPLGDFIDFASLELVRAQCRAYGLIGSLSMTSQSAASDWLKTLYSAANAAPVDLGGKLFSYPYSEASFAGNGATYTAPTASGPVADLDQANGDFVGDDGCPACETASRVDMPNVLQMQCVSREDDYNQVVVQQPDAVSIALWGERKADPIVNNAIQDASIARALLGIQVRRNQYGGDVWKFSLSPRWMLLSPMDLVTLTDELQAVVGVPVRLTSCAEQDDCSLECEAEPFVYGMCAPTALGVAPPVSGTSPIQESAGDVNPPIIFEPVPQLCNEQPQAQLWLVISSSATNYGGAQVYVSTNGGASYVAAGDPLLGSAITGDLTAAWPAGTTPDTVNDLAVDLTESNGALESYTVADQDNHVYPCYVQGADISIQSNTVAIASLSDLSFNQNGTPIAAPSFAFNYELMSYATAVLTAANKYTLKATGSGNHLDRSVFDAPNSGSVGILHTIGNRFAFLSPDGTGICKINMAATWVGVELFFKVVSFNQFGAAIQSLSDVPAYSYTPTGVPYGI